MIIMCQTTSKNIIQIKNFTNIISHFQVWYPFQSYLSFFIISSTRMKDISIFFTFIFAILIISTQCQMHEPPPPNPHLAPQGFQNLFNTRQIMMEAEISRLEKQLQELQSIYLPGFIAIFHGNNSTDYFNKITTMKNGAYFVLVAKMYLYGMLDNPVQSQLQQYKTDAVYLASYFYFKTAAEKYGNSQAYYWLGMLQQFKMVPDRIIQGNLANMKRNKQQQILYEYLKTSHLSNGQSNLYMASVLGFDPASLILAHMNREPFGTSPNCTTALAYYLSVLKNNLFEPYTPKLIAEIAASLEDQLFSRKKLVIQQERNDHQFVVQTGYFDEETIQATLEQANRFYTGSRGIPRDTRRALRLYERLSDQGNNDGRVMAGLMNFRGQGTPRNVKKAQAYFKSAQKDEISEFMLLTMDYFEIIQPNTKHKAIQTMKAKVKSKKKQGHLMDFIIGAAGLKGQIDGIDHDKSIELIDRAAADGNPSARLLMAILFTDGVKGLKYGCPEATKYLSEDSQYHQFFSKRLNMAEVALRRGNLPFSFFKYFELMFNSHRISFTNALYLLEMYRNQVLRYTEHSWSPKHLSQSGIYTKLKYAKLIPDVYSFLVQSYSFNGQKTFTINQIDKLLNANENILDKQVNYMLKKIVKRGVVFEKRGMLRYYEYKLAKKEGAPMKELQSILGTLASGDSRRLYVLEARYLLGQLYHQNALANKSHMTALEQKKIMGEYNRAVKSELLGKLLYQIQQYKITGKFELQLSETHIGQDFLTYIFILSIVCFVMYYQRSKRFDHFHKVELQKQLRRAQEEQQNQQQQSEEKLEEQAENNNKMEEQDPSQPIITEDPPSEKPIQPPQGIRIGSSQDEN